MSEQDRKLYTKHHKPPGYGQNTQPIFKKEVRRFGVVGGAPLFAGKEALRVRLASLVRQMEILASTCLQRPATGDLKGISKTAARLLGELDVTLSEPSEAANFFDQRIL